MSEHRRRGSRRNREAIRGPHEIAQCFRGVYVRSREEVS